MGAWSKDSKTHVAHMDDGDFYGSEQSTTLTAQDQFKIILNANGQQTVLKESVPVLAGEVVDAARMSKNKLQAFFERATAAAKAEGVLLSLHLKATMMKVSDPIVFGHAVRVYYKDVFAKHADTFNKLNVNPANGVGDVYAKIESLPADQKAEIEADLNAVYESQPTLAMVNSDKGITNL
ncbi:MAG: NADP-dependent isocitrate dehydrogenase, partial [Natronospirillum sp.]